MTSLRFDFQREVTQLHRNQGHRVLNVGSWDDPGQLGALGAINCDLQDKAGVHVRMNALQTPWPFEPDVGLVVLGDILEHMPVHEIEDVLTEAHRVATHLAITCPEETRPDALVDWREEPPPRNHCTIITRELLAPILEATGWKVLQWHEVDYEFVPRGHFVYAERA